MKKFILDKESDKLIPWSEYIHEKKEIPKIEKDDKESSEKTGIQSGQFSQEPEKSDSTFDETGSKAESVGSETERQIYPKSDTSVPEQIKESDKVVVTKEDTGPPGIRRKKAKKPKPAKRKTDSVDGTDHKEKKPTGIFYKRPWVSL